jgi:putative peptidoglycan lipid II flippase
VEALALACTAGFILVSIPTVIATRRLRGRAVVAGLGHAELAGIAAAAAGASVGLLVTLLLPSGGTLLEVGSGFIAALLAVVVFGVMAFALDKGDLRATAGRLRRFTRSRG